MKGLVFTAEEVGCSEVGRLLGSKGGWRLSGFAGWWRRTVTIERGFLGVEVCGRGVGFGVRWKVWFSQWRGQAQRLVLVLVPSLIRSLLVHTY